MGLSKAGFGISEAGFVPCRGLAEVSSSLSDLGHYGLISVTFLSGIAGGVGIDIGN